jgi:hypothetical protein
MLHLSYTPRAPLNQFVERMWLVAGGQSPRRERILPSGTIELVVNLRQDQVRIDRTMQCPHAQTFAGAVVSGTYSAAIVIDALQHALMMGVHFRPAGASAVLGDGLPGQHSAAPMVAIPTIASSSSWAISIACHSDNGRRFFGSPFCRIEALRAMLHEGEVMTGAAVTLDPAAIGAFYATVKEMPAVAGVALTAVTLQNFRELMAENMYLQIFLNAMFAGIIAFGVVYNSARVSLSERERELASLRVLGFIRGEISLILLGELAVVTVAGLLVGALFGYVMGEAIMTLFNNEVYRLSFVVSPATLARSFLVVIAAAVVSACSSEGGSTASTWWQS